jgi:catechol 2,3-dioxygenase-like lactoylglutathione lyase family enzyme
MVTSIAVVSLWAEDVPAAVHFYQDPQRFPLIALAVDDLDAAEQNLLLHGVELPWGIEADADSRWVMFHDPAGNLVELVQF